MDFFILSWNFPNFLKKFSIFLCSPITYTLSSLRNTKSPLGICIFPSLSIPVINIESLIYLISQIAFPSNPSFSSIVNPTKSTFPLEMYLHFLQMGILLI